MIIATCGQKLKVSSSSPVPSYVQRSGLCSNPPANAYSVCEAGGSIREKSYSRNVLFSIKFQAQGLQFFFKKRDSDTGVFLLILENI